MDSKQERQYLQLPKQTLTTLSFCEPSARQLSAWVSSLPMANIGETSRQLYHAIIEFNQLKLADQSRYDLLDLVRGPIHYVCNALNRRYLTQTVVLDDNQRKIANLAQALQTHLATGYKIIIQRFLEQSTGKAKEIIAKCIHRALADLAPNILRSYQLYLRTPGGIWLEIHQLYQVAVAYNLTKYRQEDEQNLGDHALSIQELYCRILLMGTCQPNQLHQRDLGDIYAALESWSSRVQLEDIADEKSTLIINPESDAGPVYRHLLKPQSYVDYMGLNTAGLVRALHQSQLAPDPAHGKADVGINIPTSMNPGLIQHLVQSWGGMKQRSFSRTPSSGEVDVAIGLIATHFHISGGVGFYKQLYEQPQQQVNDANNPFMGASAVHFDASDPSASKELQDVWDASFDAGKNLIPEVGFHAQDDDQIDYPKDASEDQPKHRVNLINTSPRGYCLRWKENLASNVQTGEVLAITAAGTDRWNLGVIRWIRQAGQEGTQMGIELIAPNAQPCAVRVLNKTGSHGDYMRGLLVPEIKTIGQSASLVAPRMPFQVGQKVGMNLAGKESKYQLTKKLQGTSTFSQFQIRSFETRSQKPAAQPNKNLDEGFESLWKQL